MIIINAGAYKNGSTWVQNIMRRALPGGSQKAIADYTPPPMPEVFDQVKTNPSNREMLWKALNFQSSDSDYITFKIHFWAEDLFEALLPPPGHDVRFINIRRDPRDVLISRYYHEKVARFDGEFDAFFDQRGRNYLKEYVWYHEFWEKFSAARPEIVLQMRYETLKRDYDVEVRRLFDFLDFEDYDMNAVRELKDLQANRKSFTQDWMKSFEDAGGNFYRKGIIGDYKNHMSKDQLEAFDRWAGEFGHPDLVKQDHNE